jgi:hypothetical protein
VLELLHGNRLIPKRLYAVYNPILLKAFIATKEKLESRAKTTPDLFFVQHWRDDTLSKETNERRESVAFAFEKMVRSFPWNKKKSLDEVIFRV